VIASVRLQARRATLGHEAIVYGRIVGASWRVGERFTWTHELNHNAFAALPETDDWPWVVRGIFAMPAPYPEGTYRHQIIHFGMSMKDEPSDRGIWDTWLIKFEKLLRQMYWLSTVAHIATEFEAPRVVEWLPTDAAIQGLYCDPPQPVTEWVRSIRFLEGDKAEQ
jgi:hypothetical protein